MANLKNAKVDDLNKLTDTTRPQHDNIPETLARLLVESRCRESVKLIGTRLAAVRFNAVRSGLIGDIKAEQIQRIKAAELQFSIGILQNQHKLPLRDLLRLLGAPTSRREAMIWFDKKMYLEFYS